MNHKAAIEGDDNILVHSTKTLMVLKSIIQKGFFPSYADEIFARRKHLLLMVSFSDIQSKSITSQADYGRYIIGVSREWAFHNKLQPVIYTYNGSELEQKVINLIDISVFGYGVLPVIQEHKDKGVPFSSDNPLFKQLIDLTLTDSFSKIHSDKLVPVFGEVYQSAYSIYHYVKNHIIRKKDGSKKMAFNDREWRYILQRASVAILN